MLLGIEHILNRARRALGGLALALLVGACGGGGSATAPPPVAGPPPTPEITLEQLLAASRFGAMATFGPRFDEIESVAQQSPAVWLEQQFSVPVGFHQPVVTTLLARADAGEFAAEDPDNNYRFLFRRMAWWNRSVDAPDAVRQRVAFALSQIFVVSDEVDALFSAPYALSNYYDTLLTHAFGNYRNLLRAVTLHPAMGIYLSHVNNARSNPSANTFPDENYAREVMQLFSIGLFELNTDGTLRVDGSGNPIPTYDNDDIREFAKVFTGLSYGGPNGFFGRQEPFFRAPMRMFDGAHEPGEKRLLNGFVVPAGQTGMQDIEDAVDNLFNHPNVGPFIGKQLIQRLVTSNPSPAYVERVALAFNDNGSGVRGDMRAVLRAIFLDPEATAAPVANGTFGKLREPVERHVAVLRQFNAFTEDGFFTITGQVSQALTRQHPLSAPSVFNFFLPSHSPAGELAALGLLAPEFQITDNNTIAGVTNVIDFGVTGSFVGYVPPPFPSGRLSLEEYTALAEDPERLLDRLDLMLTYGTLRASTRAAIRDILTDVNDPEFRARVAIYLVLVSPDYAVRI